MDNFQPLSNQPPQISQPPQPAAKSHPTRKWILGFLIAFVVIGGAFRIGYVSGSRGYVFNAKNFSVVNKGDTPTEVDYALLWEALKIVQTKYIDAGNIDPQKILYGAISGAIAAAGDEYTQFFDPETYAEFKTELQGSFSGIGAEIDSTDGSVVVVAPLEGSPAEKAGLQARDLILKINNEDTAGMTAEQAANKIRGPEGSEVVLSIYREGRGEAFDVSITRQKIEIKSVNLSYKDVNGKRIAVLKISRFGDDSEELMKKAVADIQKNNPAGVVVDLRNDPGGYLATSVAVASQWLEAGKLVVTEAHSEKDTLVYNSDGSNGLGRFKTVVLINGGSASAAEILAGALKDNGKAQLIGEKSFGKGSVQELVPFGPNNEMAVKVTIAKWITPSGQNLNTGGLEPDIKVELTEEDFKAGRDPQLDKALQEMAK